ncbi:hypothetical protein BOTBODRAFT_106775 [Botryobasidium botryosum FD-172 SS1]|uniref:protein-tyrosine-phosphatase n=1 Tax=Botryobasidium botryosum (strain FD-172 SS1) TaxID=930990 RepID=A0A067MM71_BOTB1|nr:hypothetical protein BOTBODRAFT_106775 [Botryobasidium botryosum FD-172 SS1]
MSTDDKDAQAASSASPANPRGKFAQDLVLKLAAARAGSSRAASLVIPRLYLSDAISAMDAGILRKYNITHILSVTQHPLTYPELLGKGGQGVRDLAILHIPLMDTARADLLGVLQRSTEYIQGVLDSPEESGNVLVHCIEGISRSVAVVCAYLIFAKGYTAAEAVDYVKSKRSVSSPNPGFVAQLSRWAERLEEQAKARVPANS